MTHAAITVDKLSKAYRIGLKDEVPDSLVGAVQGMLRAPVKNWRRLARLNTFRHQEEAEDLFWALRDVSFEVPEGEVLGIIGRNGAGKSTLLKILSRITEPTAGKAVIRGRVSSLLEVGTGFHPDLTGRDNVYMNGTILGMTKREIDRKFDEIVDFSGVEKFLDTPIKHYSSGMKVRLAFAVAAHLEPEILIIDEVLAVGDAEFQKKCLGKMQDVARGGRTVLFVSHNMSAVTNLCDTAVLLGDGSIKASGPCTEVVERYHSELGTQRSAVWRVNGASQEYDIQFEKISVELKGAQPHHHLEIEVQFTSARRHDPGFIAIDILEPSGNWIMQAIPSISPFLNWSAGSQKLDVEVDLPPLVPGDYMVGVWVGSSLSRTLGRVREAVSFTIADSPTSGRTARHCVSRGYIVPTSRIHEQTARMMTTRSSTTLL